MTAEIIQRYPTKHYYLELSWFNLNRESIMVVYTLGDAISCLWLYIPILGLAIGLTWLGRLTAHRPGASTRSP